MQMDKDELLNKAKELLKVEMTEIAYETWFGPVEITEMTDTTIVLKASSKYAREMLETRYADLILNTFKYITNRDWTISVFADEDKQDGESGGVIASNSSDPQDTEIETSNRTLNPKYTFETFVVGNNNRFAHAAAIAVADKPGESYNPLFLYGGVGLGKTHLMQAIGNRILQNNRSAKILYVTSEKFTNQMINAIKDNKNEVFRNRYRTIDVLLIDDIQFIAGKERTQEEFFHTFNTLHEANKQIILSSDRPPKEIPTLEDRLRSRFEWGLIADIQAPDFETRMAILKKKADVEKLNVPNEVMVYIATKIKSNIRELEGALIRIIAYSSLTNREVTVDLATEALKDIISNKQNKSITIDLIQDVVATYFNLRVEDLKSQRRTRNVAYPRQIAMYLSRKLTDMSLPKIGEEFGGRDHTTVIHAYEKISESLNKDESLEHTINDITKKLTQK